MTVLMATREGRALIHSLKAVRQAKREARAANAPQPIVDALLAVDRAIRDAMKAREPALSARTKATREARS